MPCIHTPPADALVVEPAWLTETVVLLARGVAADLGFDRLPILADALEDAGCDNFAFLNHLRSDEPHRVECWALRRLLRTTLLLPGDVPITFAYCPPGSFLMGDVEAGLEAQPVHPVTLTTGFHMGIYPVTQEQWRAVMLTQPSQFQGITLPVECVSWNDAKEFCSKVTEFTGRAIRLATEAEWEYACRARTTTTYYWGQEFRGGDANCNFGYPFDLGETTPVGFYSEQNPHPWGLGDMLGNVWEWCEDRFDFHFYARSPEVDPVCDSNEDGHRAFRGGSWLNTPHIGRSANRDGTEPDHRHDTLGFRVVYTAE